MKLSSTQKGIVLILLGLIILIAYNMLNVGVGTLIVVAASALIAWGFIMADGLDYVKSIFNRKK